MGAGLFRLRLQIGLVDLDHVRAGRLDVLQLRSHRIGIGHDQAGLVGVVLVDRKLAHGEGPGTVILTGFRLLALRKRVSIEGSVPDAMDLLLEARPMGPGEHYADEDETGSASIKPFF